MTHLCRKQLDHVRETTFEAPRSLGRRKKRAIIQHSANQERARRAAAHAKAFDAVVAGRPFKPGSALRAASSEPDASGSVDQSVAPVGPVTNGDAPEAKGSAGGGVEVGSEVRGG